MSIDAFHVPDGAKPLPISVRRHYNLNGRGHAVQIVGYELDPSTGKVLKWKIKNSWGVDSGDNGYYHMYRDYFRTFVTGIAYFSDADEPSAIH
jgi:bleomycin hydrolase